MIDEQILIDYLTAARKSHQDEADKPNKSSHSVGYYQGRADECDFQLRMIGSILSSEPEATTGIRPCANTAKGEVPPTHEDTTKNNTVSGEDLVEPGAEGQNEQVKEVCPFCGGEVYWYLGRRYCRKCRRRIKC